MEQTRMSSFRWRGQGLVLLIAAPLVYLMLLHGAPIPQDRGYHIFADVRTCLGWPNFGNVASNLAFLAVGVAGLLWCLRNPSTDSVRSWAVFFAGVALVFFGSAYYHYAPNDDTLVWDRLPMTIAFMGLFAALMGEHLGRRWESRLLVPALVAGIASVVWWRMVDDLRVYIWVQLTPLLVIPYLLVVYRDGKTHRQYLLYGVGFYAAAKIAEYYDYGIYQLTAAAVSGHSVKHLLAAAAPFCVYLMLRRQSRTPLASSQ